jgi:hypothetical protein
MKTVSVTVKADGLTSCSAELEAFFAENNQDVTVLIPAGRYYLDRLVTIKGGRHLHIKGDGAVFVTHFTSCGAPADNVEICHCTFEKSALPFDSVNHGAVVINVTMSTTPDYHPAGAYQLPHPRQRLC